MPATRRIREQSTFVDLRRRGRRSRSGPVSVTWAPAADAAQPPQVGYAVGKVVGNAVVRNKVRRRLQAIVAALARDLAPGTYLVGAGPAAATATYGELSSALMAALTALPAPGGLSSAPHVPAGAA